MSRFSFNCNGSASGGIYKTNNLRITALTPCLLRLETDNFTDLPTQTVWNRRFDKPDCKTMQQGKLFTVETAEALFCIDVVQKKMSYIILSDGTMVEDFESGNLLGTARTLDNVNGAVKLQKGIMSRSGVAVMDDSKSLLLQQDGTILPRKDCTDLYYFAYGHDYLRCLKDFYRLTGPVPLIPKFALGNWWSRYYAYTQEGYRNLMQEFIDRKIPITVSTIDMDWHWTDVRERFGNDADPGRARTKEELFYNLNMPGWTGYSWNSELFPDHKDLLLWLKDHGFHITMNVHPSQGIRPFEDCYIDACRRLGKNPENKEHILFDVANTEFVAAYMDAAHHPHEEEGVDFWWLDWQQGKVSSIPGLDPLWALNHYHTLDNGRGEKRPMILSRYAGLGSHRYPIGFSGDTHITWKSMAFQPYFTSNAANAGYTWWSHDIGGHMRGVQDDELYLRWLQFGVFSPINRLHSSNSEFMGKEPWKRCWAVSRISEEFLRLRHRMIPLLYSANYQTHQNAIPICMPLYYKYDSDEAYKFKNNYLFCSQLLVAPMVNPEDKRLNLSSAEVWLPEGRWTDIFSGRAYQGGQTVTMYRDLDSIPVLAGEGTIMPLYKYGFTNDLSLDQPMEIHVWRGDGNFSLYEDDGESKAYQKGAYAITKMSVSQQESTVRFIIMPPEGMCDILPQKRHWDICYRDIRDADVSCNIPYSVDADANALCIHIEPTGDYVEIILNNIVCAKKPDVNICKKEILSRIQASNDWKSAVFSSQVNKEAKLPRWIQSILSEFDAMI